MALRAHMVLLCVRGYRVPQIAQIHDCGADVVRLWLHRYRARVHGRPDPQALAALARGVTVEGVRYGPVEAGLDSAKGENAWLTIGLREGRNREVRRIMAYLNLPVSRLIRVSYGPFQLGNLPRGVAEEVPARVLRDQLPRGPA